MNRWTEIPDIDPSSSPLNCSTVSPTTKKVEETWLKIKSALLCSAKQPEMVTEVNFLKNWFQNGHLCRLVSISPYPFEFSAFYNKLDSKGTSCALHSNVLGCYRFCDGMTEWHNDEHSTLYIQMSRSIKIGIYLWIKITCASDSTNEDRETNQF